MRWKWKGRRRLDEGLRSPSNRRLYASPVDVMERFRQIIPIISSRRSGSLEELADSADSMTTKAVCGSLGCDEIVIMR